MDAVYGLLETFAQLHLVNEEPIHNTLFPATLYLVVQGVVLEQGLVVKVEQVDVDVVGVRIFALCLGCEGLHELRFTTAAYAGDHLDVPCAFERLETVHV